MLYQNTEERRRPKTDTETIREAAAAGMDPQHYTQLIDLLNEKIHRLELDNDKKRREINRLKRELKAATKEQ